MKLLKSNVDKMLYAKNGSTRQFIWDQEIPGFAVRIYPSNKKAFIYSYSHKSRKHLITIGNYGVLTIEQARIEAKKLSIKIHEGTNPLLERQRDCVDKSLGSLANEFLEKHSKLHKKSWKEDERRVRTYILPHLGKYQVASIVKSDILHLHIRLGKHSIYEANKVVTLLGTIFKFGIEWGFVDQNYVNPSCGIKKYKELERERWVTPEEMPRLAKAIQQEDNIYVRSAIWLYILTGLRKNELLTAKWENVDVIRKEFRIVDTKNGSNHSVALSDIAMVLLNQIPRLSSNPYIIVGALAGKHLVNISKPWGRIRRKANVSDVRLHDLRRTTGSWLAQQGNSLHLIGRVLNHQSTNTTKIYARFGQDHLRLALENHGKIMEKYIDHPNVNLI